MCGLLLCKNLCNHIVRDDNDNDDDDDVLCRQHCWPWSEVGLSTLAVVFTTAVHSEVVVSVRMLMLRWLYGLSDNSVQALIESWSLT